ncbi:putative alpha beta hydrolase fold protein [Rosellinia necatrix]|uniref:Putative alpha beta hydrolase fold protein n=1 Tax=Rosellinia necatrix TaxID=77044 RepID=A0A1W2TXK7_ROSNE|nr:putative alpha beta hydrolase fold protein [Rosellinia necatrix]
MADTPLTQNTQPQLPILSRLYEGASITTAQTLYSGVKWARGWYRWFYPPDLKPDFVKIYECRPYLPISIFFPRNYDQTSPQTLPAILMIHGGGFCMGSREDDDAWSERFATAHNVLVVGLNYRKAPAHPFPTAIHDLEALVLAVFDDESLPLDRARIAIGGFFTGGNLALSVCQLPSIRTHIKPAAVVAIYPLVDQTIHTREKLKMRHYKPELQPGTKGISGDPLAGWSQTFQWSYIPIGHDLRDPLLSPYFAARDDLPPHIFLVGAELDHLSHEAWRMANKLASRPVPAFTELAGRANLAADGEDLILDDEKFAFQHISDNGEQTVGWLLVPDETHGFDHLSTAFYQSEGALQTAERKTVAYQRFVSQWLHEIAWKL